MSSLLTRAFSVVSVILALALPSQVAIAQTGQWTLKSPAVSPGGRAAHAMAYDPIRRETVVFGGYGGPTGYWGDTWAWNGTTWTLKATTGPSPRANVSMSFDSTRGVIVLFGGYFGTSLGETWEWNGTAWTQRFPAGPLPPARNDYGMAFDSVRNVTVMHGGGGIGGLLSDTWEWNGTSWNQRIGANGPPRGGPGMVFDSRRGVCVLFGGDVANSAAGMRGDTYEYNGTSWTLRASTGPSPRRYVPMAFDTVRGVTVLTGGNFYGQSVGGTFDWNGTTWSETSVGGPGAWQGHNLAFDTSRNEMVQFGGTFSGAGTNQTWVLQTLKPVFTDWTSFNSSQAVGVLNGRSVTLSSTVPDRFFGSVVDGTSTVFSDATLFTPALPLSDIIFIRSSSAGVPYTIDFGQPVTNPVLHLQSLASTLTFVGVSPVKVSGQSTFAVSGNQVIGSLLNGPVPNNDANGTVRLPGTFTLVSFTAQWAPGVDGIGLQLGLGVSVPLAAAGPSDNATFSGNRTDPGAGSTTTYNVGTFTVETGSSWTLGSGEILNAPGGLVVQPGAVLIANGTINGPLVNNGLLIVPITQANLIARVVPGPSRGVIIIPVPQPLPGVPPVTIPVPLPNPPQVEPGEMIVISGSGPGGGAGGGGGGGGGSSGGGGTVRFVTPSLPIQGTIRLDSLLEVTGPITQSATGVTRLFIAGATRGETYSAIDSEQSISLDGGIQVVLRPELFDYTPSVGDTFDVMFAPGDITLPDGNIDLTTYLTTAGAARLGITLPRYISPFAADPDALVQFPSSRFSYSIVNGGTTLRLTMTSGVCSPIVTASAGFSTCPGSAQSLSVTPLGSGPFTFQWRKRDTQEGAPVSVVSDGRITGATSATLNFAAVQASDTGFYDCVVTRGGTCGSSITTLTRVFIGCDNPANVASPGQGSTCDDELTADDIIVFINWFTQRDPRADFARPGPTPGQDGEFTADDIILFVNSFTQGC